MSEKVEETQATEEPKTEAVETQAETSAEAAPAEATTEETVGAKTEETETKAEEPEAEVKAEEPEVDPDADEEISYHAVEKEGEITAIWEMQGRKHLRTISARSGEGEKILSLFTSEIHETDAPSIGESAA